MVMEVKKLSMCIHRFVIYVASSAVCLLIWVSKFVECRKRRDQRRSPASIPVTVLNLDEDEPKPKQESEKISTEVTAAIVEVEKNRVEKEVNEEMTAKTKSSGVSSSTPSIPCLDRLREELSCDICLEICYEPSTTRCGHSFCKKCLSSAADKCGRKCPKCRQKISTGKICKVNTVLWNTIQVLFPQEVEARKAGGGSPDSENREAQSRTRSQNIARSRAVVDLRGLDSSSSNGNSSDRRRNHEREWARSRRSSLASNLRAMVRAINIRMTRGDLRQNLY